MLTRGKDVGKLARLHAHPRDAHIVFEEEPHKYYVNGVCIGESVTGILKAVSQDHFDAPAMAKWKSEHPDERYNAGLDADGAWIPMTEAAILKKWDDMRDLGTDLHARLEAFLNGCPVPFTTPTNAKEYMQGLRWLAKCGLEPFRTEWLIYDEDADVAGSVDFVARDPATGHLVIIDWKRCRNGPDVFRFCDRRDGVRLLPPMHHMLDTTLAHWACQVNLYRVIIERNYGYTVSGMQMVCLYPDQQEAIVYQHARDDRVAALLDVRRKSVVS